MSILKDAVSLFYSGIDHKKGNIVLNKKEIVSAYQKGSNTVEATMTSGEKFELAMDAVAFGKFIFDLTEVQHKNVEQMNT